MATKKQRRRSQKERRHEYETVWVDAEGNELEEPPDDAPPTQRDRRQSGRKPQQKRSSRSTRTPLPPSWRRSIRRSLILGAIVLPFMYLFNGKATPGARIAGAVEVAVLYTALFIPFTYYADRFGYRRWQRNQPTKR